MLLGDLVERNAQRYPDKTAIIFEGQRLTYLEFRDRVTGLARALLHLGLKPGDRVAILLENCQQYGEMYFAIPSAGMVAVPLNYRLSGRELTYILNNSEAKVLLVGSEYLAAAQSIRGALPHLMHLICVDGPAGERQYEDLLKGKPDGDIDPQVREGDVACLMYTSGTTGVPKGAMLTHRNLLEASVNMVFSFHYIERDDITLVFAPLYHVAASSIMRAYAYMGATSVVMRSFDPAAVLETIQRERVTAFWAAPTMINMLLQVPNMCDYDLSSLRLISYAAAPMPVQLLKRAMEAFKVPFVQCFGMTETSPSGTVLSWEDHLVDEKGHGAQRLLSIGKEMLNVQVRVIREDGSPVDPGEVGEIVIKGDTVMMGYWKMPRETAEVLKEGWYYTGDLGTTDEDGYFYIVDRKKDMIISGGENIYSREVEEALYAHPAVLEAAVIGVPDDLWGESVKAIVVLKPGCTATEAELIEQCKAGLASYKKPKSVSFVEALPKNASGKILKNVLREEHRQAASGRA